MKQIIFIILLIFGCLIQLPAQEKSDETALKNKMKKEALNKKLPKEKSTLPYRSLSEFGKDTIEFFHYNFHSRADQYIGKTIKDVLRDAQLKPLYFSPRPSMLKGIENGIIVYFSGEPNTYIKGRKKLYIYIKCTMPSENVWGMIRSYDCDKWVPQHEAFFGNGKVEDVSYRKD